LAGLSEFVGETLVFDIERIKLIFDLEEISDLLFDI
jgi:hypothetical protein